MSRRVLIIEDEPGLVMALTQRLASEGYGIETATDGETGLEYASREPFDVIILDVLLPHKGGFDVCRDLRQRGIQTPIIMLTARGQLIDRVLGLKLGADDYLVKPFEMLELLARVEALLRRGPLAPSQPLEIYRFGDVHVDFSRTEITRNGEALELTPREFKLLRYLIEHRGSVVSRDELLNEVWGYDTLTSTRTIDVHVSLLRQKIESDPSHPSFILTMHGYGYKFTG